MYVDNVQEMFSKPLELLSIVYTTFSLKMSVYYKKFKI